MTENDATPKPRRRRSAPLLWASGALAALTLVLGVNGTLSTWSTAIIHNDTDTVQAAGARVLTETDGTNTCVSTDTLDGSNEYICSTINKYGGTAKPLNPGDHQSVTVTMKNTGTESGTLTLAPKTCSKSSGSSAATVSICDVATVTVACTSPSTVDTTGAAAVLSSLGSTTIGVLAAGASTDCTFDVALPGTASPQIAGQIASQELVWTLAA